MNSKRQHTTRGEEGHGTAHHPQLAELLSRTKQALLELANELKLKGVSKLAKSELARRVLAALGEGTALERAAEKVAPAPSRPPAREVPRQAAPARPARQAAPAGQAEGKAAARPAAEAAVEAPPAEAAPERLARPEAAAPGAVPAPSPAEKAKLDLGPGAQLAPPREEHIPWSYAQDRVTAMAIDPETLYVYWEVTDQGIERARAALGSGAEGAWLDLRVYDTTGLIFDGSNAHSFFDHGIGRSDRQWFFTVGKPSSSTIVEVGMRSPAGAFVRIARSSRVDFPRSAPAPWVEPEWMTVLAGGEVVPAGRGAPARPGQGAPPPPGPGAGGERVEHVPVWILLEPGEGEKRFRELFGEAFERVEWSEAHAGEGWYELQGRLEWQVGPMVTSWEAGPFTYPVQVDPPTRQTWEGGAIAYTADGITRVVYGPWQVVIRNLAGRTERAVLGRWQIYRSWSTRGGMEEIKRMSMRVDGARGGASERVGASELVGASGWLWQGASEVRLGGASELWRMGASEVRLRGASERLYAGASEVRAKGASERRLAGASEWRLAGASERRLAGASERRLGGASEERLGGGDHRSDGLHGAGGAGEQRPGTAEPWPGRVGGPIGGAPWPRRK